MDRNGDQGAGKNYESGEGIHTTQRRGCEYSLNLENIPSELKALPQWVLWNYNKGKPKHPYNPKTLEDAKANDFSTWADFETSVKKASQKGCEIGFEFSNSGLAGVDMDHVLIDGNLTPEAAEIVALLDSYTEISPSGDGVHIFVNAPSLELEANKRVTTV